MGQEFVARKGFKSLQDANIEGNLTVSQDISGDYIYLNNLTANKILYSVGNKIQSSNVDVSVLNNIDTSYVDTLVSSVSGSLQTQINNISGGSGVSNFLSLTDTPSTYTNNEGKQLIISGGSIIFKDEVNELYELEDVSLSSPQNNQVLSYSQSISGWTNIDLETITISGGDTFLSKNGGDIVYINIDEHLKVGNINNTTNKENGQLWYDNGFNFYENGQQKTFENIIDDHIMKALERQIRVDSNNSSITYVGEAEPNTNTSDASWRIQRIIEISETDFDIQWSSSGDFDQIFDNRESLSYN